MLMHDIRCPINNITSLAQLLKTNQDLPEPLRHLVELLIEQSRKVYQLTQFHNFYQQLESGNYQPDRSGFNLLTLLVKIQQQLQLVHPTNVVDIRVNGQQADLSQSYPFYADVQATELMLQNLIQNAVEASPAHASVGVDIRITSAGEPVQPATIVIHNQGVIPEAIRACFFEKFVTSGKKKGTGLGTYIALRVAQAHGGSLSFITSVQQGTTLNVRFPNTSCLSF